MSSPNKLRPRRPRRTARKSVPMLDKHMSLEQGQTPHLEGSSRAVLGILGRLHQPRAGTTRSPAHNHNRPMACRNNPNMVTQIFRHQVSNQSTVSRRTVSNQVMNLLSKATRPRACRVYHNSFHR